MHVNDLIAKSIRIPEGGINTYNPCYATYRTIRMSATAQNHDHHYCCNNSTICFCIGGEVFVTPFTFEAEDALEKANFEEASFYVPLSNGSHPVGKLEKVWFTLRKQAEAECLTA